MLAKTIKFKDYNGQDREQTFLFNLTQAEVTKLELSTAGGLVEKINAIAAAKDGEEIIKLFEEILAMAYGEKTPDGLHFQKTPELSRAFSWTPAYDILFMELVTSPEAASAFINGIIPQAQN
jgi:hypothetical protein